MLHRTRNPLTILATDRRRLPALLWGTKKASERSTQRTFLRSHSKTFRGKTSYSQPVAVKGSVPQSLEHRHSLNDPASFPITGKIQ